jgi:hypothetical protein
VLTLALAGSSCNGDIAATREAAPSAGGGPLAGAAAGPGAAGATGAIGAAGAAGLAGSQPGGGQLNLAGSPAYFRVLRLTNEQWTNSVQSILALPAPPTLAEGFQDAVSGTTDFANNEHVLDIDSRRWSDSSRLAHTQNPLRSKYSTLICVARRFTNTNNWPLSGSRCNSLRTSAYSPSNDLRMSQGRPYSSTRI